MPFWFSFPRTSVALTADIMDIFSRGDTFSAPGSRLATAKNAEASNTTLFATFRGRFLSPIGNQFIGQAYIRTDQRRYIGLKPLQCLVECRDQKTILRCPEHHLLPVYET